MNWWLLSLIAVGTWGIVGLLQKISASLLHPAALLFWVIVGLSAGSSGLLFFLPKSAPALTAGTLLLGLACGLINAVGSWCLFAALQGGAPATVAIPLTALYPLITVLLAVLALHESISLRQSIGALLAICGGAMLSSDRGIRSLR